MQKKKITLWIIIVIHDVNERGETMYQNYQSTF
jgi:hypothetical protein